MWMNESSMGPDLLCVASSEASWSGSILLSKEGIEFMKQLYSQYAYKVEYHIFRG